MGRVENGRGVPRSTSPSKARDAVVQDTLYTPPGQSSTSSSPSGGCGGSKGSGKSYPNRVPVGSPTTDGNEWYESTFSTELQELREGRKLGIGQVDIAQLDIASQAQVGPDVNGQMYARVICC